MEINIHVVSSLERKNGSLEMEMRLLWGSVFVFGSTDPSGISAIN